LCSVPCPNPSCGYLGGNFRGPGCCNFDAKIQHSEHPQRSCGSSGEPNIYEVKWRHLPPVTWPVTGPSEGEHLHHDHALHRGSLSTHDEPCLCRSPHGNGLSTVPRRERTVIRARLSFSSPRGGGKVFVVQGARRPGAQGATGRDEAHLGGGPESRPALSPSSAPTA